MSTADQNDPANWSMFAASKRIVGVDIGGRQDHSFITSGGVWNVNGRSVIGVRDIIQLPLDTPLDEVAKRAAELAREYSARVIFDATNNAAFGSIIAPMLPAPTANWISAATIHAGDSHNAQPERMVIAPNGQKIAIAKWGVSKRQLVQDTEAEIRGGTLKFSKSGDWETLKREFETMEEIKRASGSIGYSAPSDGHDDGVMSSALTAFGCRYLDSPPRQGRRGGGGQKVSALGWS